MRVVVASYPRCGSILLTRAIAGVKSGPTWNDLADRFPDIFKTHRPYSDELVKEYDRGVYIFGDPVLAVISAAARLHRGHPGPKVKAMLEGTIRKLDLENRTAVIAVTDGKKLTVKFPEDLVIGVSELETVGTMGGDLEDLDVGYIVEFEVHDHQEDGTCTCLSLESIS